MFTRCLIWAGVDIFYCFLHFPPVFMSDIFDICVCRFNKNELNLYYKPGLNPLGIS